MAVDTQFDTKAERDRFVEAAVKAGFPRIGIGNLSVHVDNDPELPPGSWGYPLGTPPPYDPFEKYF